KAGIAIHPNVEIEAIQEFLNDIDLVVVMTVVPGFGGQKFLDTQLSKINKLYYIRESAKAKFEIEIDGGINEQTSKQCIANGADVLVAGSYIYEGDESEYENLINSIR
ncbi:MAG TPA: ribulose-phosphate 3-epimerase, partial [Pelagibacterales bacterium]|nr:ribulose-phosphate 3-epimerase [Pelagibacterales bacterium]